MAVSTLTDNPFGRPRPSWRSSIIRALVIEVVLFAFLLLAFLSPGSHNPVPFFLALILQFPSSLLFVPLTCLAIFVPRDLWDDGSEGQRGSHEEDPFFGRSDGQDPARGGYGARHGCGQEAWDLGSDDLPVA